MTFDTPLRSAALGVLIVALTILCYSQSSRLASWLVGHPDEARRRRFRMYTIYLLSLALLLVFVSEGVR